MVIMKNEIEGFSYKRKKICTGIHEGRNDCPMCIQYSKEWTSLKIEGDRMWACPFWPKGKLLIYTSNF